MQSFTIIKKSYEMTSKNKKTFLFHTKFHGDVYLHKRTQRLKSSYAEREYFVLNNNIIKQVLENPIQVRQSRDFKDDYLYYKLLKDVPVNISDQDMMKIYARLKYLVVVICTGNSRIKTIYPARRMLGGKIVWRS